MGTISGIPGMQIHILQVGIGGDAGPDSGPTQFSAVGQGLDFSWAAGQALTPATYNLAPAPLIEYPKFGFTYHAVSHLAGPGSDVDVRFDSSEDCDGFYTYAADLLGSFFDDSAFPCSVRVWLRYEYLPRLAVTLNGTNTVVTWPAAASNFVLEASFDIAGAWSAVTNAPQSVGSHQSVMEPVSSAVRFYRLRKP